ncbi:MFS transporter [Actinacidiphila oryziradicis]|uniref:MFS transporter n=2 Tax=Actinacidiphila oryziradicis TaxID=2571141 RepID=A0A4U0SHK2_9ACTN|nr:MFS transporter [Actinacidiphila oryziradicis]TKA09160.1 MFS transporter [Actinacidiphila oryziradicis]
MPAVTSPTEDAGRAHPARPGAVVAVLAFGGIVVSVMNTLVVPLISQLPTLLHATASDASWAITATLLAGAVATPVVGRLGDMFGKRRMLLLSVCVLVAGSIVCALSGSLAPMVVGRTLQGCGVGVIPLGISIMRDELPPDKIGSSVALMSSSLGVGGALGLPGAALLAQHADWHVLFWVSAALGAVVFALVLAFVPESRVRSGGRFDLVGGIGLSAGLVCLLLAISKGADWGWTSGRTDGLFSAAVLIFLVWGRWELRSKRPLVDLRTTARRQVLLTNLASVVVGFAMYAMSLVLPQLLQMPKATGYGLGQTMLVAGLCLAPGGLVMMVVSPLSAWITANWGPKFSLMLGSAVVAAGYGLSVVFMDAVWQLIVVATLIGGGIGLAYGAMPALIMSAVPQSETASANGLNSLMRSMGTSISAAVVGVVLAHMTTAFGTYSLPSRAGFRTAMIIGCGAAAAAVVLAGFLPNGRPVARVAAAPDGHTVAEPAPAG